MVQGTLTIEEFGMGFVGAQVQRPDEAVPRRAKLLHVQDLESGLAVELVFTTAEAWAAFKGRIAEEPDDLAPAKRVETADAGTLRKLPAADRLIGKARERRNGHGG